MRLLLGAWTPWNLKPFKLTCKAAELAGHGCLAAGALTKPSASHGHPISHSSWLLRRVLRVLFLSFTAGRVVCKTLNNLPVDHFAVHANVADQVHADTYALGRIKIQMLQRSACILAYLPLTIKETHGQLITKVVAILERVKSKSRIQSSQVKSWQTTDSRYSTGRDVIHLLLPY